MSTDPTLPPAAPDDLAIPMWAESFRVGDTFPFRGWVVRVSGHFLHDGQAAGFALTVEGPTAALMKRIKAARKRAS